MTFSLPSAFAAATRASIPPQAEADVAVLAVLHVAVPDDVLPQAVTTTKATTARPRWRVSLANFILGFPSKSGGRNRVQADLQLFVGVGDARRAGRIELRLELGSGGDRVRGDLLQLRPQQPLAYRGRSEGEDHFAACGAVDRRAAPKPVDTQHRR